MQTFNPVWGNTAENPYEQVPFTIVNPLDAAIARRAQELVGKLSQPISDKK